MILAKFISNLRKGIAEDQLDSVLKDLRVFLENSPKLDTAIIQSARFNQLKKQINLGIINKEDANIERNKLRVALLELLTEIEEKAKISEISTEVKAVLENQPTIFQYAEKIYNITNIEKANFS